MRPIPTTSEERYRRLFFCLFGTLFILAPIYFQPNLGGDGLLLPFNSLVWLTASFLIALGGLRIISVRRLQVPDLASGLFMLLSTTTLAGFLNSSFDPVSWLFRTLALWGGVLFFFALHQYRFSAARVEFCLYIVLASTLMQALIGLLQVAFSSDPVDWLPPTPYLPMGIFQQINVAASFQATGLAVSLYLISRPNFRCLHWFWSLLLYAAAFAAAVVVGYSGSRVGAFGALTAVSVILLCRFRQLAQVNRALFVWVILVLAGGYAGINHETSRFHFGMEKMDHLAQGAPRARAMIYGISFELLKEKPWVGHGVGSFAKVFQELKPGYFARNPGAVDTSGRTDHPHNEFLYWMVEGGLISLTGILAAVMAYLWLLIRLGLARGGAYAAMIFPIALHTQVEYPLYLSSLHWFLFLFLIFVASSHRQREIRFNLSPVARGLCIGALVALPVFSSAFFSHALVSLKGLTDFVRDPGKDINRLQVTSENLYFAKYAEYYRMQTYLAFAQETGDKNVLALYVGWAEKAIGTFPDAAIYGGLAVAYHKLGDSMKSQYWLLQGRRIYPGHELMEYSASVIGGVSSRAR